MSRERASALAIIIGSVLFIVTMVLHPTGGDLDYIHRIASVVVGSHALAIVSLAVVVFGFLGLTRYLGGDNMLAVAGMVAFSFGAVAGMCAAVLSGLALPLLAEIHADSDAATLDLVKVVLGYNHAVNAGFARVFMMASVIAMIFWSAAIIRSRRLPAWTGFVGLLAGASAVVLLLAGAISVDVHDFGMFVFGYSAWAILVGILFWRQGGGQPEG